MAEFKSFADLGGWFQTGMQALGNPAARYGPRYSGVVAFDAALHRAGQHFVDHFRQKIEDQGPGWDALAETTIDRRIHFGIDSDKALDATGQLKEAIKYEVTNHFTLEVGVDNKIHEHPNGESAISMEDLMVRMETGYMNPGNSMFAGQWVPERPVFSDTDFESFATLVTEEFAAEVLGMNGRKSSAQGRNSKGRFV